MRTRLLLCVLALGFAAAPAASLAHDRPDGCGGVAQVISRCQFRYDGGPILFQAQNVRVVTPGVLHDDKVTVEVHNLTTGVLVDRCEATTIAAGCGKYWPTSKAQHEDLLECRVSGQGSIVLTLYACGSAKTPAA